jgi:hypothetical protein
MEKARGLENKKPIKFLKKSPNPQNVNPLLTFWGDHGGIRRGCDGRLWSLEIQV